MTDQQENLPTYANFIYSLCKHEMQVENARLALAQHNSNFDSFGLFRKLDQAGKGFLSEQDLTTFLKENNLNVTESDLLPLFIKGPDGPEKITYNDFLFQILPHSNHALRNSCLEKFGKIDLNSNKENDSRKTERFILNIYAQEIQYHKELQKFRLNLETVIKQINPNSIGTLTFNSMEKFMTNQGFKFTKEDFDALLRRLEKWRSSKASSIYTSQAITSDISLAQKQPNIENKFSSTNIHNSKSEPLKENINILNITNYGSTETEQSKSPYAYLLYQNVPSFQKNQTNSSTKAKKPEIYINEICNSYQTINNENMKSIATPTVIANQFEPIDSTFASDIHKLHLNQSKSNITPHAKPSELYELHTKRIQKQNDTNLAYRINELSPRAKLQNQLEIGATQILSYPKEPSKQDNVTIKAQYNIGTDSNINNNMVCGYKHRSMESAETYNSLYALPKMKYESMVRPNINEYFSPPVTTVGDWISKKYNFSRIENHPPILKEGSLNANYPIVDYSGTNLIERINPAPISQSYMNKNRTISNIEMDVEPQRFYQPKYTSQYLNKYSLDKHYKPILRDPQIFREVNLNEKIPLIRKQNLAEPVRREFYTEELYPNETNQRYMQREFSLRDASSRELFCSKLLAKESISRDYPRNELITREYPRIEPITKEYPRRETYGESLIKERSCKDLNRKEIGIRDYSTQKSTLKELPSRYPLERDIYARDPISSEHHVPVAYNLEQRHVRESTSVNTDQRTLKRDISTRPETSGINRSSSAIKSDIGEPQLIPRLPKEPIEDPSLLKYTPYRKGNQISEFQRITPYESKICQESKIRGIGKNIENLPQTIQRSESIQNIDISSKHSNRDYYNLNDRAHVENERTRRSCVPGDDPSQPRNLHGDFDAKYRSSSAPKGSKLIQPKSVWEEKVDITNEDDKENEAKNIENDLQESSKKTYRFANVKFESMWNRGINDI